MLRFVLLFRNTGSQLFINRWSLFCFVCCLNVKHKSHQMCHCQTCFWISIRHLWIDKERWRKNKQSERQELPCSNDSPHCVTPFRFKSIRFKWNGSYTTQIYPISDSIWLSRCKINALIHLSLIFELMISFAFPTLDISSNFMNEFKLSVVLVAESRRVLWAIAESLNNNSTVLQYDCMGLVTTKYWMKNIQVFRRACIEKKTTTTNFLTCFRWRQSHISKKFISISTFNPLNKKSSSDTRLYRKSMNEMCTRIRWIIDFDAHFIHNIRFCLQHSSWRMTWNYSHF